ncbi:lytic murein transglycosylase [Pantoea coffeiphila]|uniref:lytic murein transglycosylase n=1 Tax=Pantoea coffeiphila TaxID=1465635 RepID=UPI001961FE28|nr:membrane-bound lytic murein transglycosylase B [Pantoea coffeiphila]
MKLPLLTTLLTLLSISSSMSLSYAAIPPVALSSSGSATLSQQGRDPAQFPGYVEQLKATARLQGFNQATIDTAFTGIHFVDRAIQSDRSQLEHKVTLNDYLSRVLTLGKIEKGRDRLTAYRAQLDSVAAASGVSPSYIVALWAMESQFGTIQGKEDVISALATLAFEGRREAFFTKELMAALKIIQQQGMTADELKGSWAGAMGQSQFMPSSFLNYGKDGDGDGKIDIWSNVDDVFASIANYLQKEGWKAGQGWGTEVTLPQGFDTELSGLKNAQAKTPLQWQQIGVTVKAASQGNAPGRAWIITPEDGDGRSFMVYDNFRTLMHWNRSYYFAISIGMMADAIAQ